MSKKLSRTIINELQARERIISEQSLIVSALRLQKGLWLNSKLKELGLDINKKWSINYETGIVTPVKDKKDGKLDK